MCHSDFDLWFHNHRFAIQLQVDELHHQHHPKSSTEKGHTLAILAMGQQSVVTINLTSTKSFAFNLQFWNDFSCPKNQPKLLPIIPTYLEKSTHCGRSLSCKTLDLTSKAQDLWPSKGLKTFGWQNPTRNLIGCSNGWASRFRQGWKDVCLCHPRTTSQNYLQKKVEQTIISSSF